jgi:Wadjet anti plasmid transformation system JetA-like protein
VTAPARLFDRLPRGLFGPLGDPYAEIYWSVLAGIYRHEFEREPFVVVRGLAIEIAEAAIVDSGLWAEKRTELEALAREDPIDAPAANDEGALIRALARRAIARLERAGWIHFQYRSGIGDVLSFPPHAARIVELLMRIARDEQPILQGYVHSIASLLEPRAFAERPGVSLYEAKRHTLDLVRELKILERNIHLFTQRILDEASKASDVLAHSLDRYQQAVMASYHRLKTVDNVFRQRSAIMDRLSAIELDAPALERAKDWYGAQLGIGPVEANAIVREDIAVIRAHFDAVPELVEQIDARNARFSHVTLRKLMYLLRQDRRTEGQLQFLVDVLAKQHAPELELDVFRSELLYGDLLYTPPRERTKPERQAIRARKTKNDLDREIAEKLDRPFSRKRVDALVRAALAERASISLEDIPLEDDEDYVRLIYIAAYGLDGSSSFLLRPSRARVERGPYGHPAAQLEPRSKRRGA